jgi:hypothetical protein
MKSEPDNQRPYSFQEQKMIKGKDEGEFHTITGHEDSKVE